MRNALRTCLLLSFLATSVFGQKQTDLAQAQAHVNGGRFVEAEKLLVGLVDREPSNARGWYLLGFARHAQGRMKEGLVAHEKAAGFPQTPVNALYNAACANARLGNLDEAIQKLGEAQQAGFSNPGLLGSDTDLDNLRGDPRFQAFLPPGGGADPSFLEDVRILHEWRGEAANDQFGWEARNTGDVDGDGANDFLITSAYSAVNGFRSGRLLVLAGPKVARED